MQTSVLISEMFIINKSFSYSPSVFFVLLLFCQGFKQLGTLASGFLINGAKCSSEAT